MEQARWHRNFERLRKSPHFSVAYEVISKHDPLTKDDYKKGG